MSELPSETLVSIFQLMDPQDLVHCSQVCHQWMIAASSCIWQSIKCYSDDTDTLARFLKSKSDPGTHIRSLCLVTSSSPWAFGTQRIPRFRRLLQSCRQLCKLHLDFPALNDDDVWNLVKTCPNLSSFAFLSASDPDLCISDEGLSALGSHAKNLKHLFISASCLWKPVNAHRPNQPQEPLFSPKVLNELARVWKDRLLSFGFRFCPRSQSHSSEEIIPVGIPTFSAELTQALETLILSNPHLQKLQIDWPYIKDQIWTTLSEHLTELKSLYVGNLQKSDGIQKLVTLNVHLSDLSLYELNATIDPVSILSLFDHQVHLERQVELKEIELDGISRFPQSVNALKSFSFLSKIKIIPSSRAACMQFPSAMDMVISELLENCPFVKHFEAPVSSDEPIIKLAENCRSLEYLDVIYGTNMTDYGMVLLAKNCPQLSSLLLGSATKLTDQSIQILAKSLQGHLKRIVLPFKNLNLTLASIQSLATHCHKLEGLANVPASISSRDLIEVIPEFQRLLVLGRCINVLGSPGDMRVQDLHNVLKKKSKRLKYIATNA
jgi:hypothetical protein